MGERALADQPDDLSSNLRTHVVEVKNQPPKLLSDPHIDSVAFMCPLMPQNEEKSNNNKSSWILERIASS